MAQRSLPTPTDAFSILSDEALLRQPKLFELGVAPFSSSTLWRKVKSKEFPAPIKVSPQITAWRVGDIRQWLKCPGDFVARCSKSMREPGKEGAK